MISIIISTIKMTDRSVVSTCLLGSSILGTGLSGIPAVRPASSVSLAGLPVRERNERPTKAPAAAVEAQAQAYAFAAAGAGSRTADRRSTTRCGPSVGSNPGVIQPDRTIRSAPSRAAEPTPGSAALLFAHGRQSEGPRDKQTRYQHNRPPAGTTRRGTPHRATRSARPVRTAFRH